MPEVEDTFLNVSIPIVSSDKGRCVVPSEDLYLSLKVVILPANDTEAERQGEGGKCRQGLFDIGSEE